MVAFYQTEVNRIKFWTPEANMPTARHVCPHMLALPPDCFLFCATQRRTPAELLNHIIDTLGSSDIDPIYFELMMDWYCMAAMLGTGTNSTGSSLLFALPAVMGTTDHLHEWAHLHLALTLGPAMVPTTAPQTNTGKAGNNNTVVPTPGRQTPGGIDVGVLVQVTAAMVAAFRVGEGAQMGAPAAAGGGQRSDETKAYSEFQLAKLKGFCCVQTHANLPPI